MISNNTPVTIIWQLLKNMDRVLNNDEIVLNNDDNIRNWPGHQFDLHFIVELEMTGVSAYK